MKNEDRAILHRHSEPAHRQLQIGLWSGRHRRSPSAANLSVVLQKYWPPASSPLTDTTDIANSSVPLACDPEHSLSPHHGRSRCSSAYAPAIELSLLALWPNRCNPCPALVIVGARESGDSPSRPSTKISPNACIPHQRGSRFSGQRWRRAVRESAAWADQSLPSTSQ